jgi:uncharacterized membrane protein
MFRLLPKASKMVFILGAITGLALIIITPPFQVPDEGAHFFRAYQTATSNFSLENRDGRIGANLPRALLDTRMRFDHFALNPSCKVSKSLFERLPAVVEGETAFCSVILPYPPAAYAAQAIGITIGRVASARPLVWLYFARVMNLALFLLMAVNAIRWMPELKWGMALLALMPMTLYEAASASADTYTIGISFLIIALLLRCAAGVGCLSDRDIRFLLIGSALLALAKPGYSPLIMLTLLIPAQRFGTQRRKLIVFGGMLIIVLTIGTISIITMRHMVIGPPGVDSAEQLRFILNHPLKYFVIVFRCIFRASQYGSFIGWFGWLELRLPLWIIIPYALLLIAVAFDKRSAFTNSRQRIFIGALFGLQAAAIYTIQYLSYTPVGKRSIDSVQGRYFIPFAALFLLVFCSRRISYSIDEHALARRLVIGFIIFAHVVSAALIIQRYYLLS